MFKLQRAELSWSRLGPLLSPADYNITKRIIHKSCYHLSLTISVYLIQGNLQVYLALSSPPCYMLCLLSLQPVPACQASYRSLVLTPPIKFCSISIPRWHVPFIKIKPTDEDQSVRHAQVAWWAKYFLLRNISDLNSQKYVTYLVIWNSVSRYLSNKFVTAQ